MLENCLILCAAWCMRDVFILGFKIIWWTCILLLFTGKWIYLGIKWIHNKNKQENN